MAARRGRRAIFYLMLLGCGLAFLELGSWAVIESVLLIRAHYLPWGKAAREVHARDGIDFDELRSELAYVYQDHIKLHPYRWYAMPENFHGRYVNTDADGFRSSPPVTGNTPLIGFFGSSTMFSVTTKDEHSIPAFFAQHLDRAVVQARNYGVGGYSASAELALLIERARADRLSVAVFYDGGGEVVSYLEKLQYRPDERYYDVLGFPTPYVYLPAIRTTAGEQVLEFNPYTLQLIRRVRQQLAASRNANLILNEQNAEQHADRIVDLYLESVRDIAAVARAHGIVPVFIWHTSVYTTGKPLSDYEKQLFAQQPAERLLAQLVHRKVASNPALREYHFFDLTDALDGLDNATYFLDENHVSFEANRAIAERIAQLLAPITPADYWLASPK